jgi:GAF domain-containing protein
MVARVDHDDEVVRVAEMFGDIARALAGRGPEAALDRIVHLAVDNLDGCEHAGISLVENRRVRTGPNTGEVPAAVDQLQDDTGEGPCLDSIQEHEVFRTHDLVAEERWPQFAPRAHEETGVRSILSVRLYVEEHTMGALNLYSTQEAAFADEHDVALAAVFASHAAVALSAARREDQLEQKAQSRDVIGRAKGILTAQSRLDDEAAFDVLRRASQRLNVKLTDVAEDVIRRQDETTEGVSHPS